MMDKPKFVYVIYIASTPEKIFNALIDPKITRQYWGNHHNASDWKVGSRWEHRDFDKPELVDIVGKVVESSSPNRLVVTWVRPADEGNPVKTSRVTFQIEPLNEPFMDVVRLTVTHDELEPDSEMFHSVSFGWPALMSGLKTLLETGKLSPAAARRPC